MALVPQTTAALYAAPVLNRITRRIDYAGHIHKGDQILSAVAYMDRVVVELVQSGGTIREFDISRDQAASIGVTPTRTVKLDKLDPVNR